MNSIIHANTSGSNTGEHECIPPLFPPPPLKKIILHPRETCVAKSWNQVCYHLPLKYYWSNTSPPLVLCCDRLDHGSRQVKCDLVDIVMVDLLASSTQPPKPHFIKGDDVMLCIFRLRLTILSERVQAKYYREALVWRWEEESQPRCYRLRACSLAKMSGHV